MTSGSNGVQNWRPRVEDVRAEIADFQKRIREAGEPGSEAFRTALLAYAPFLRRRFRLLAQLDQRRWC